MRAFARRRADDRVVHGSENEDRGALQRVLALIVDDEEIAALALRPPAASSVSASGGRETRNSVRPRA